MAPRLSAEKVLQIQAELLKRGNTVNFDTTRELGIKYDVHSATVWKHWRKIFPLPKPPLSPSPSRPLANHSRPASQTSSPISTHMPIARNERALRRVVVTGLGAITPLGVGIRHTWTRLLNSESGIVSIADIDSGDDPARWKDIPSTVAGIVPVAGRQKGAWNASSWLENGDKRRMAQFTQYAIAATEMALADAGWRPHTQEEQELTGVCLGSGIGNLEELYHTSISYHTSVRSNESLFPPGPTEL